LAPALRQRPPDRCVVEVVRGDYSFSTKGMVLAQFAFAPLPAEYPDDAACLRKLMEIQLGCCASRMRDFHRPLGFDTALSTNKDKDSVFVAIAKDYWTCSRDCHRGVTYRTSRTDVQRGSRGTLHQSHGALVELSGQQRKSKRGASRQICRLTVNGDAGSPPAAAAFEVGRLLTEEEEKVPKRIFLAGPRIKYRVRIPSLQTHGA
jgi:hypothetical protein